MAGDLLYTSEMIAGLQVKIDEMVTAMAAQTVALGNINSGVAQSVTALNVKAGTTKEFIVNAADIIGLGTLASVTLITSIFCFSNGVVTFSGNVKPSAVSNATYIDISNDDGVTYQNIYTVATAVATYVPFSKSINVKAGKTIKIKAYSSQVGVSCIIEAGAKFKYDLIDLANDGGFTK